MVTNFERAVQLLLSSFGEVLILGPMSENIIFFLILKLRVDPIVHYDIDKKF